MPELTPKQQRFAEEYLVDMNATQAAIRAGYSERTAYRTGCDNLKKPHIRVLIERGMEARSEKTGIDAQWVLDELEKQYGKCDEEGDRRTAVAALEKIGKHVDVEAFKEKREIENTHVVKSITRKIIDP